MQNHKVEEKYLLEIAHFFAQLPLPIPELLIHLLERKVLSKMPLNHTNYYSSKLVNHSVSNIVMYHVNPVGHKNIPYEGYSFQDMRYSLLERNLTCCV